MADRVGQQLGNYRLFRLLGQGAFAAVYLGEHQYLERLAAIKVLHMRMEPGTHESFRREARTIAQLHHPHIVGVHDFGFEDQTPYLVMEYMPNGTLRERISKGTRLPFEQIVTYVKQIALALDYAHEHHVIHRDIKPENILLGENDEIVLSDFGIAVVQRRLSSLSTQNIAGTSIYMAPEQIQRKPCASSDQYALGVMVYEWLCGEPPFDGSLFEVFSQHLHKPPPSLRARMQELPPDVEDAIFGALAKDPQHRFPTVQEFAIALSAAFDATQPLSLGTSVEHEVQEKINQPLARVRLLSVPSSSEQDHSDDATQSPLKTTQQIERKHEQASDISPQTATRHQSASKQHPPVHQQVRASAQQNQNRIRMLRRLRRSYSDLISQSLQGVAWLELGLADKPDAVQNATNLLLRISNRTEELLPTGTSISQAYDEAEHELLILGEPGAGKSTLLLDLAQQLVMRAEQDPTHPLPVILPLSSWAVKRPPLQDWIAEQLIEIYDIPRKLSVQWVQEDSILPLLDGLDEMEETARSACIAAINAYHRDHTVTLVVCSRTTEYEAAASYHRLVLQGAVVVQPLSHEDVEAYLIQAGKPLTALHSAMKKNAALHDLAKTPLMLNILIMTYQGTPVRDLSNMESHLLQQVWDDYVQRMVERKGSNRSSPLKQTRSQLGWLARQMRAHNQTVFYLEHVQPDWLTDKQRHTYEWFGVLLPAIMIGVLVSMLIGSFFLIRALSGLLVSMALGGMLGGVLCPTRSNETTHAPVKTHHRWGKTLSISIGVGLMIGFSVRVAVSGTNLSNWLGNGLVYGVMFGLSTLLLQSLLFVSSRRKLMARSSSGRWAMLKSVVQQLHLLRALLVALLIGLSEMLSEGLINGMLGWEHYGLSFAPTLGLSRWPSFTLSFGLASILISVILERSREAILLTERVNLSWRNLRKRLFAPAHLRLTVILTGCITVFFGLNFGLTTEIVLPVLGPGVGMIYAQPPEGWLSNEMQALVSGLGSGLGYGLGMGLLFWLLLGLYQSIAQERIEDQDRRVLNQGTRRSLRNSLLLGLIGGTLFGGMGIVAVGLSRWLSNWLSQLLTSQLLGHLPGFWWVEVWQIDLSLLWSLFIVSSILFWMITGGLAAWRHYLIRFLLRRAQTFPWKASQFLDDATARILLQRLGGGYRFTHRLLLDFLADAVEA